MGHIEATRHLSASPDALWATVSDPSTWDQWFTIHEKWMKEPPAQLSAGDNLTAKIIMLGMANKIEWTVKTVEAPTRLVLSGEGMAGVQAEFGFVIEPEGDGSSFTASGDFQGALIKGALAKAVEKDGAKQLDKTLEKLDALASASA